MMKYFVLGLSLFILNSSCKSEKKVEKEVLEQTILEKVAYAHGFEHWNTIQELKFTFNVDRDTMHFERHWVWNTKTHEVTGISRGDTITYNSKEVDSTTSQVDAAFINDKYWLLAPINILWDEKSITYTYDERSLAPISNDSLPKLTIVYGNKGGYTPGDAYDFYLADDYRIKEWVFRKGNAPEPSSITTWEGYEQFEGLTISTMHKNKEGNFKLYFTGVAAVGTKN
jgi:hypothetical protein